MKDPNRLCLGCMNEWDQPDKPCPVCGFVAKGYERPIRWLPLKHILNGKYMIGKAIGEGGFGITYVGWDLNLQVRVAIKEYFPVGLATRENGEGRNHSISALPGVRRESYRQGLEKFMTEAKNLSKFYNLQGIVAVKDFFFENDTAYMVMEYVDGITLGTYLKNHGGQITEQEALMLFHPVMDALKVVHASGIIHRDISPDNIMMTKDGRMKLIDFGAARFAGNDTERSLTIILKHGYAPAEQYQSHGNQGPWTDVYAICATMYRMITGKVPPSAMDRLHEDTLEEFGALGCRVSEQTAYAVIDKGMAIRVEDRYRNMDELIQGLYETGGKKIKRKKKKQKSGSSSGKWIAIGAAAAIACFGGVFLLTNQGSSQNGSMNSDTGNLSADSGEQGGLGLLGGGRKKAQSAEELLKHLEPVSEEELQNLQKAAYEAGKSLSARGDHLVSIREDGSVTGSGANESGELDTSKWNAIRFVSTGVSHTLGIREDGTAAAAGDTGNGKCAVDMWRDLAAVSAGDSHSLGLKADGTVLAAGKNDDGQCNTASWQDITDIAAGAAHSLGLKSDGTVEAAGDDSAGQCQVGDWKDIAFVYAFGNVSAGLKKDGTVVLAGDTEGLSDISAWKQVTALSLGDGYIAGLLSDGHTLLAGGKTVNQETVNGWENMACLAAGDETLFGKKEDGSIVRTSYSYGTAAKEEFLDLKKAAAGGGFLAGLKNDGTVVAWGVSGADPGLSETKEWTDIADIAANAQAVLGVKEDGSVLVCGEGFDEAAGWSGITQAVITNGLAAGLKADGSLEVCGEKASEYDFNGWTNLISLAAGLDGELVGVKSDGTVIALKRSMDDQADVVSAAAGVDHIAAVHTDGTVNVSGSGSGGYNNVYSWRDVTAAAAGAQHTIGLKADGTVLAAGSNSNGQCDVNGWTDVVSIAAGEYYTVGIQSDGTMLLAGKLPGEY